MIVSVHLADVGLVQAFHGLRHRPRAALVDGLLWSTSTVPVVLGHVPLRPLLGRIGLIGVWRDDEALSAFIASGPWSERLADAYEARLEPIRSWGSWSALPTLADHQESGDADDEPVGALTLGRLRASQAGRFARASAAAERSLLDRPGLGLSIGLARPPFLSTFSLWQSLSAMREYAYGASSGHAQASRLHKAKPFHHESIFVRLRPYRSTGQWGQTRPFADVALPHAR